MSRRPLRHAVAATAVVGALASLHASCTRSIDAGFAAEAGAQDGAGLEGALDVVILEGSGEAGNAFEGDAEAGASGNGCPAPATSPNVVVLASDQNGPAGIAVAGGAVYWTDEIGGTVMSVSTAGGTPTTLASGQGAPYGIAASAAGVFWTNGSAGTVAVASADGGAPAILAASQVQPRGIAVQGTTVYWTNFDGDSLASAPATAAGAAEGGTGDVLASALAQPSA
ncbi:MAG TPA: hypothetical protein VIY73_03530, partial [Polyangiaceae bacterium]